MQLSEAEIQNLLQQVPITQAGHLPSKDAVVFERLIKYLIEDIRRGAHVEDKTEFNHYGSGYASYIDCWLYRPTDEFRFQEGNNYEGLVVLFSRLSKYFVMGQGQKSWDERSASSYLPDFDFVDRIEHPAVVKLEQEITPIIESHGLCRVTAGELAEFLPSDLQVPTILADSKLRQFDALFYWED